MTSTCDSAKSLTTLPLESDLDDEQIRDMLDSPLSLQEREASADQPQVYYSYRENVSEQARGDLQLCSHTKESRVKNLIPTETVLFPWHIQQCKEKTKHYLDSMNRKMLFVNFKDKFSPIVWKLTILTWDTKHLEENKFDEELAQRERALRETQIRSTHKVEELKRDQEMRIDDFSRQESRESQATRAHITNTGIP